MSNAIISSNTLIPFTHQRFGQIRVLSDKTTGEPWFVAKDVARALEYSDASNPARLFVHIPDEWRGLKRVHTPGGEQEMLCLSEQGLYFFLARSDKPGALPFQKWLAGDVLPAVRKHGGYLTPDTIEKALLNPDILIQLATTLKEEQAKRQRVESKLAEAAPKAKIVDETFARRKAGLIKLTDFVRKFDYLNALRIKSDLLRLGYFYKTSGNAPYRVYSKYRERFFVEKYNEQRGTSDIYVTPQGAAVVTRHYRAGELTMKAAWRGDRHGE